jgi:hypothetical protein
MGFIMNQATTLFVKINEMADFLPELKIRKVSEVDFDDALFLLNSQPHSFYWHKVNEWANEFQIYFLTDFDIEVTEKWLTDWEIPFDGVISSTDERLVSDD